MQILDGSGKGYRATVNNTGKLTTDSVVQTEEAYFCSNFGRAYSASTLVRTLDSTDEHFVMHITNNSQNYDMRIWVVNFGWNGGSINHNRVMKWKWYIGTTVPTGNYESSTPGNLNLKSNRDSEVLVYRWNGVGAGMTGLVGGGVATEELFAQGHSTIDSTGIPVIGYNTRTAFSITGEEVGDMVITIRFFMTEKIGV